MSLAGNTNQLVIDAIETVEDLANPDYTHPVITVAAGNSSCSSTRFPASLGIGPPAGAGGVGAVQGRGSPGRVRRRRRGRPTAPTSWRRTRRSRGTVPARRRASRHRGPRSTRRSPVAVTGPRAARRWRRRSSPPPPHWWSRTAPCPLRTPRATWWTGSRSPRATSGPAGPDELYGYGMLDADAAVQAC